MGYYWYARKARKSAIFQPHKGVRMWGRATVFGNITDRIIAYHNTN